MQRFLFYPECILLKSGMHLQTDGATRTYRVLAEDCKTVLQEGQLIEVSMEFILKGGPQDGCKVTRGGGTMPPTIYLGPKNLGDGFSAWSTEWSDRFPARYDHVGEITFQFKGYKR